MDGATWYLWNLLESSTVSVVKAFFRLDRFKNEVECYRRLAGTSCIGEFTIPRMLGRREDLVVIQISLVTPPFLLDFGKVHLDAPPPHYADSQFQERLVNSMRAQFGVRWREVLAALTELETTFKIYHLDPRVGNFEFDEDDDWKRTSRSTTPTTLSPAFQPPLPSPTHQTRPRSCGNLSAEFASCGEIEPVYNSAREVFHKVGRWPALCSQA